jgi:VanZ family protein
VTGVLAFIRRWGAAILMMAIIFAFSSTPAVELPNFSWADTLVKKGGHVLGYGLLALSYLYGLSKAGLKKLEDHQPDRSEGLMPLLSGVFNNAYILAWLLAVLYAVTDEFHQSFVLGRHPSAWDVALFDSCGAWLVLWLCSRLKAGRRESKEAKVL